MPKPKTLEQTVADERAELGATLDDSTQLDNPKLQASFATMHKYAGLAKVEAYLDLVSDDLRSFAIDKLVIFGIHKAVLERCEERLKEEFGALLIYGGTSANNRVRRIEKFQTKPEHRVMVAQIKAAGTAIDLFAAANVDLLEPSWSPAWNAQAIMRVHRSGQERPVLARFVALVDDPVDQRLQEILRRKTKALAEAGLAVL